MSIYIQIGFQNHHIQVLAIALPEVPVLGGEPKEVLLPEAATKGGELRQEDRRLREHNHRLDVGRTQEEGIGGNRRKFHQLPEVSGPECCVWRGDSVGASLL
jgi:hypothetical protein